MLHVVTTGAYYPPVVTTWKIKTTGASQLKAVSLCNVLEIGRNICGKVNGIDDHQQLYGRKKYVDIVIPPLHNASAVN